MDVYVVFGCIYYEGDTVRGISTELEKAVEIFDQIHEGYCPKKGWGYDQVQIIKLPMNSNISYRDGDVIKEK